MTCDNSLELLKVRPVYKCQLCGSLIFGERFEAEYYDLEEFVLAGESGIIASWRKTPGSPRVFLQLAHKCSNGVGLATLIGFERKDNETQNA